MKKLKKFLAIGLAIGVMSFSLPTMAGYEDVRLSKDISVELNVGSMQKIEKEGFLSAITIRELDAGSLVDYRDAQARTITLSLKGTNYRFANKSPEVTLGGGFNGMEVRKISYGEDANGESDTQMIEIELPYKHSTKKEGTVRITGLKVKSDTLVPGDLNLKVAQKDENGTSVKVAEVTGYGVELKSTAKAIPNIKAGDDKAISFTLEEKMRNSLVPGREVNITLTNAYVAAGSGDHTVSIGAIYLNGKKITNNVEVNPITSKGKNVGFSFELPNIDSNVLNTLEFENVAIYTTPDMTGNVTLTVDGKALDEAKSIVVAKAEEPYTINMKGMQLVVGDKNQIGGSITISENSAKMLNRGYIKLRIPDEKYIGIKSKPEVEVIEGDLEVTNVGWSNQEDNIYLIKVTKLSNKPSVLKISDFKVSVNNMAPDGSYSVFLSGSALAPETPEVETELKNFVTVGSSVANQGETVNNTQTSNTDSATNSTGTSANQSLITQFTVGSKIYTVNGKTYEMPAEPYIAEGGRTMVPLRYAAEAAGISPNDVKYSNGVITIPAKQEVVMVVGSTIAVVNNTSCQMASAPQRKDSRVYVPISELARVLGIDVKWNSQNKTATFTK